MIGMSALGKPASKVVHRLSLADKDLEIKEDTILTPCIYKITEERISRPLREQYKDAKIKVISRTGRYTISKSDRSILTGRKRCRTDQGRLV